MATANDRRNWDLEEQMEAMVEPIVRKLVDNWAWVKHVDQLTDLIWFSADYDPEVVSGVWDMLDAIGNVHWDNGWQID